jgi:hypothetical protein
MDISAAIQLYFVYKYMIECFRVRRSVGLKYSASESNWTETMNGSLWSKQHFALCSRLHAVQQLSNSDCPGNSLYMNIIFWRKPFLNWSMNCCRPLINKYFNPSISHFNKNKIWTRKKIALYITPTIHNLCCPVAPLSKYSPSHSSVTASLNRCLTYSYIRY